MLAIIPLFFFFVGAASGVSAADMVNAADAAMARPSTHGLSLLPNGQIAAWGANEFAQVLAGQGDFVQTPQRISLPDTRATMVVAGNRHSLAIDATGRVWAWGDNSSGQLGQGHTKPLAGMALVQGLPEKALIVAAGAQHSLVLLTDGTLWVWGANNRGQLGQGSTDAFSVQAKPARLTTLGPIADIAAGHDFVLALVGTRDKSGAAKGTVWAWGAGNGLPRIVDGIQDATVVRAAGALAMIRTPTGGYWQWQPGQTTPHIAQRIAFDKLGEMKHSFLAALANPPVSAGIQSAANQTRSTGAKAVTTSNTAPAPVVKVAATVVTAVVAATPPKRPASAPLTATVPLAVNPPVPAAEALIKVKVAAPASAPVSTLSLAGTVRLSSGFAGDSSGKVLENVQVAANGAQCSATDSQGRYVCSVPAGWSGRVTLQRGNYRFSPGARSFQNLRASADQQDFAAIYDPR